MNTLVSFLSKSIKFIHVALKDLPKDLQKRQRVDNELKK